MSDKEKKDKKEKLTKEWLFAEQLRLKEEQNFVEQQKNLLMIEFQKLAADKEMFHAEMKKQKAMLKAEALEMFHNATEGRHPFDSYEDEDVNDDETFDETSRGRFEDNVSTEDQVRLVSLGYFGGVTNYTSLKKRYKDLMKIYHPDNKNGDSFTVRCITKEYEILKEQYKDTKDHKEHKEKK